MANFLLRHTASIRILLFRWGSLIEPGLSVLWTLLSSIIVADKSKEEMYMVFLTKVMKKLCNTGTHCITICSISSKAWPPGSFAINLRPQASSKEVLRLRKAFTLPLFVLPNIQEQCVQGKYILGLGGKPSNNQMNILPIAFSLWDGHKIILALVWNLFQKLAFEQYWLFASNAPKVSCPDGIHSIDTGSVCNQKEESVLEKEKRVFNVFGP